jgi:hypothetical protein
MRLEGNWASASGEAAFKELLENYPEMDAVCVANDQMALAVLHIASRLQKPVPQSLGVVGFNNIVRNVAGTMSHLPWLLDSNVIGCDNLSGTFRFQVVDSGCSFHLPRCCCRESDLAHHRLDVSWHTDRNRWHDSCSAASVAPDR